MYTRHDNSEIIDCEQDELIPVDCSYFVYLAMLENGYAVKYFTTSDFDLYTVGVALYYEKRADAKYIAPGDVVLFEGHVGIVVNYDAKTKIGKFIGAQNKGIYTKEFVTDKNKNGIWGSYYAYNGAFEPNMGSYSPTKAKELLEQFENCYHVRRAREDRKHHLAK